MSMFDKGRTALKESVFNNERLKQNKAEYDSDLLHLCSEFGLSASDAKQVVHVFDVLNHAFSILRSSSVGKLIFNYTNSVQEDLQAIIEYEFKGMEGFCASRALNDDARRRIYDTFSKQGRVDLNVVHKIYEELCNACLVNVPNDVKTMLYTLNETFQPKHNGEVEAYKESQLHAALNNQNNY